MDFEWNDVKAQANVSKHGVSFHEALTAFYDLHQLAFADPVNSSDEFRELLIATSEKGRVLLISYTLRDGVIRLISARKATRREVESYASRI